MKQLAIDDEMVEQWPTTGPAGQPLRQHPTELLQ